MELLRISIKELPLKWASVTFLALGTVVPFSLILRGKFPFNLSHK
jgi:hypothetical protein